MFQTEEQQDKFCRLLNTYKEEFGEDKVVLYLPWSCLGKVTKEVVGSCEVRYWRKKHFGIRMYEFNAGADV